MATSLPLGESQLLKLCSKSESSQVGTSVLLSVHEKSYARNGLRDTS